MSATDELLRNSEAYAAGFDGAELPAPPRKRVAIVACMDARVDLYRILGLREGDAHLIRNAGGVVTDDVIRSLVVSQRLLGTTEVLLIQHTDCGMSGLREDELRSRIEAETGIRPPFSFASFTDLDDSVRRSVARLEASPFLPHKNVRGFVFDVRTGRLREVDAVR